jgi:hypothetical protein
MDRLRGPWAHEGVQAWAQDVHLKDQTLAGRMRRTGHDNAQAHDHWILNPKQYLKETTNLFTVVCASEVLEKRLFELDKHIVTITNHR